MTGHDVTVALAVHLCNSPLRRNSDTHRITMCPFIHDSSYGCTRLLQPFYSDGQRSIPHPATRLKARKHEAHGTSRTDSAGMYLSRRIRTLTARHLGPLELGVTIRVSHRGTSRPTFRKCRLLEILNVHFYNYTLGAISEIILFAPKQFSGITLFTHLGTYHPRVLDSLGELSHWGRLDDALVRLPQLTSVVCIITKTYVQLAKRAAGIIMTYGLERSHQITAGSGRLCRVLEGSAPTYGSFRVGRVCIVRQLRSITSTCSLSK
ncbi:hypothetical protein C8Q76DRAFT_255207 [Earliella scabrosa]|nr:hypothetical protein C8Q76DRAFT_255207 [Earliella scabrosa]